VRLEFPAYPASGTIVPKPRTHCIRPSDFARRCACSKPAGLSQRRARGARVRRLAAVRLDSPSIINISSCAARAVGGTIS